uniref:Uncharacterized protein n=1 Tax=Angiostrongylus cantonensis TaxID=6313 RepID=A0A0K0DFU2_ANGCA
MFVDGIQFSIWLALLIAAVVFRFNQAKFEVFDVDEFFRYVPGIEEMIDYSAMFSDALHEANGSIVYSEIRKKPTGGSKSFCKNEEATEKVDEAITDTTDEAEMLPPPVPPKPRSSSAMADPVAPELPERRGVLPAQVRPLVQRPPSPREAGRATPSIEPDLVGKDRYDKASKCFSYAPTKALNEAFERPKKPMVTKIERKEDEIQNVDPKEVSNVSEVFLNKQILS